MNIAILRRNGFGDLLCAYPLVLYLQKTFPSAITLFVDPRNSPLLPYLPPVKEVVIFPRTGNKYWIFFKTSRPYREQFDIAISAKTSPMKLNNLFLYWLKAKKTIAYVDHSWHSRLINTPIPYQPEDAKKMHQALKGLKTVAPHLEFVPEELYPKLSVPQEIKQKFYLERINQDPMIIVSATTTRPASRLDERRYAFLLNRLYQHFPFSVRVIGEKKDQARAEAIASHLRMPSQVYFPRNFDAFIVALEDAEYYFVGDGGVAHIGAAFGQKGVALFGETDPIEWHPLSKKVEALYDPHHVNHLSDEAIFEALTRMRGR